ncbi:hypothetical protein MTO96_041601, partial [Rhipicephalus appendiculatus]
RGALQRSEKAALQARSLDAIPGLPAVPGCPGLAVADLAGCPGALGAPPAASGGPRSYAAALAGAGPSLVSSVPSAIGLDMGDFPGLRGFAATMTTWRS